MDTRRAFATRVVGLALVATLVTLSVFVGSTGSLAFMQLGHQHGAMPGSKDSNDHDHGDAKKDSHKGMEGHTHAEVPAEYRDQQPAPVAWTDPNVLARGKVIYLARCALCHGESGDGKGPAAANLPLKPPDLRDVQMIDEMTPSYWFWRVSEGGFVEPFRSQGSIMPAWKDVLSVDDRWAVIVYQHTFSGHQGPHDHAKTLMAGHAGMTRQGGGNMPSHAGHAGMTPQGAGASTPGAGHEGMTAHVHAEVPPEYQRAHIPAAAWTLPAMLARGKTIYLARCAVCHGESGDGKGPAAASLPLKPPDLRDARMIDEMRGNYWFWRVSEGGLVEPFRSQGSTMPAWKDELSVEDRWAVIAYQHTFSGHQAPHVTSEHPQMVAGEHSSHSATETPAAPPQRRESDTGHKH